MRSGFKCLPEYSYKKKNKITYLLRGFEKKKFAWVLVKNTWRNNQKISAHILIRFHYHKTNQKISLSLITLNNCISNLKVQLWTRN